MNKDISVNVPSDKNGRLPRTLDSSKSYEQFILFDLKMIQQIAYLQRRKVILLSENKIPKCIVSTTRTTSFPGSFYFPSFRSKEGKKRDPGNELATRRDMTG